MPRSPHDTFILLFRSVMHNPVIWDKPFSKFQAWAWMLMRARVFDSLCFKRGQFIATRHYLMDEWGWNSEKKVRTFLDDLQKGNKDPMIEIGPSSMPKCGPKWSPKFRPNKCPKCMLITILNYNNYQSVVDPQGPNKRPNKRPNKGPKLGPKIGPKMDKNANGSQDLRGGKESIKQSIKQQELRTTQPSAEAPELGVSDNSQVYNLYIEKRREALAKPEWKPTDTQAIQMRANIKKLLETYPVQVLTEMVERYMADQSIAKQKWPWTFFVADPIRWAEGGAKPQTKNYVDRALAKLQAEGL